MYVYDTREEILMLSTEPIDLGAISLLDVVGQKRQKRYFPWASPDAKSFQELRNGLPLFVDLFNDSVVVSTLANVPVVIEFEFNNKRQSDNNDQSQRQSVPISDAI